MNAAHRVRRAPTPFRLAAISAALLLALAPLAASAQELPKPAKRPTLAVTGMGRVTAAPDMASLSAGVVSTGKTAREALDANTAAVADIIAAVKGSGIAERDIQTDGFSVQPQFGDPKREPNQNQNQPQAPRIVGYEVRNTVSVRVRDLGGLGPLLDTLVGKGANQLGSVSFGIAEPGRLQDDASIDAVKDARRQADLLAGAAGMRVVGVLSMQTSFASAPMPRMMAMAAKMDSVPMEAGETEVRASVSVVYEIEPL
ncbi:SIMPL domain-containing protein [Ancylobacter sp. 6x-1]|uniref:SIMPL domain-containing protein n=1 Tax=Ancylobacter crimeensis TaxID=2579147 RepID=A0ABT0D9X1_9HYPH|nr:SIMPL domain-containing protein [Ancylobacter crimeensis]MCK0196748.1 SIMPL domain-containing protein [Ancylobacter crimeensis]